MYYAYILRSEQDPETLYHGFTSDLKRRLAVHNSGGNPHAGCARGDLLGMEVLNPRKPPLRSSVT